FGVTVLGFPSRDLAPFGTGLAPARGTLGRARNQVLNRAARSLLFGPMTAEVNAARAEFGLRPTNDTAFDYPRSSDLFLQFSPPGFEYATTDLPSQVRFVGPPRTWVDPSWAPPPWWAELSDARRVVLVTQGAVATNTDELLRPTLRALAE
nr:hypothetical protein [Micromonospora sp. DSM 115978]